MTGLVTAQTYAAAMTRTYTDIAEQTARFAANLGDHGVAGPAVAAVTHAQEATQAAGTAWAQATTALQHQTTVREAYTAVPDAGGKAFLTNTTNPQPDQSTDPNAEKPAGQGRVQVTITGVHGAQADLSLAHAEGWDLYRALVLAIVRVEHPQFVEDGCPAWCFDDHTTGDTSHTGEFEGPAWHETTGAQAIVRPELTARRRPGTTGCHWHQRRPHRTGPRRGGSQRTAQRPRRRRPGVGVGGTHKTS